MSFNETLKALIKSKKSHLCIGLDVDKSKLPQSVLSSDDPILTFNQQIIKYTEDIAVVYKLNLAFYEALGEKGYRIMKDTLSMIPKDILTIADAKRGDIGNSSSKYAEAVFDDLGFDAVTVNPYMGFDSVEPFCINPEKGVFILVLTSNKGSSDFQQIESANGIPFFLEVARKINDWNGNDNIGMVLGATHPEELESALKEAPKLSVLIPGVGKQGGEGNRVKNIFKDNDQAPFIVNSSRGIIYASSGEDYAVKAREVAKELRDELN